MYLVIKGANLVISNSAALAKHLGISNLVIGLSIVAFGTSIPELAINIFSRINDSVIGLGNVIGASIANIAFILGLAAVMVPIQVNVRAFKKQLPLVVVAILLVMLVAGEIFSRSSTGFSLISRNEGIILLLFFGFFIYNLFSQAIKEHRVFEGQKAEALRQTVQKIVERATEDHKESEKKRFHHQIIFLSLGIVTLFLGAYLVVNSGQAMARFIGLSETFIGLVIVSLGTTLPEMATALAAVKQKQPDIAIGNAIGSTLFNLLAILGIAAIIQPINFEGRLFFDLLVLLGFVIYFFVVGQTDNYKVTRKEGLILIFFYILYIVIITIRG